MVFNGDFRVVSKNTLLTFEFELIIFFIFRVKRDLEKNYTICTLVYASFFLFCRRKSLGPVKHRCNKLFY